jgi:hypothetical protein
MFTGIPTRTVATVWRENQDDLLPDGMEFWWRGERYRHRPGGHTDGMSDPRIFRNLPDLDPRGVFFREAVAHDGGYHRALEKFIQSDSGGDWYPVNLSKDDCDIMFHELALARAGNDIKLHAIANLIYESVHLFGQSAYDAGGHSFATLAELGVTDVKEA